jgi:hypothetical protein
LSAQQFIVRYLKHWNIETGYRNGKQLLGQDEYQGYSVLDTIRHWCLGRAAYICLELRRGKCRLSHGQDQTLYTLSDVCRAVKCEVLHCFVNWPFAIFQEGQNVYAVCQLLGI